MNVSIVPKQHIDDVWDSVRNQILPAVKVTNGRYMLYDVYMALKQGAYQLWICFDDEQKIESSVVTSIVDYPSKRVLSVLFVGGKDVARWKDDTMQILVRWAEDNKCAAIESYGRKAWGRIMNTYGIKPGLIMFEKDI